MGHPWKLHLYHVLTINTSYSNSSQSEGATPKVAAHNSYPQQLPAGDVLTVDGQLIVGFVDGMGGMVYSACRLMQRVLT